MSEHTAAITWQRSTEAFDYQDYNREHEWQFSGGQSVQASAAPDYLGDPQAVDPEEALVAAIASCHMLTLLAICAKRSIVVDSYTDQAVGYLEKNPLGQLAITRVVLRPQLTFADEALSETALTQLHHLAHKHCFIANSVTTKIEIATD